MLLGQQSSSLRIALVAVAAALLLLLVFGVRSGYVRPAPSGLTKDTHHLAVDESAIIQDVYNRTLGVSIEMPRFQPHC